MIQGKEYYAFISYKSEDVEWAIWLQHELEHYHLPASFNGRTDIRQELRPVFRDIDELAAGNLPEQIKRALENSQNLIVVCSPQAAASPWVNQEVQTFIALGRTNRIFPFIVEGSAPKDFFPPALLALPKSEERLGGDVSKNGRDAAFVKVVSGMLGVAFDSLWQRYEREKATKEREEREKKEKLLIAQSRFVAEKEKELINERDIDIAKRLLLEVLPKDLKCPNRPYTLEAERSFRLACEYKSAQYILFIDGVVFASISPDGKQIISTSGNNIYQIWNPITGHKLMQLEFANDTFTTIKYDENGIGSVLTYGDESLQIRDEQTERTFCDLIKSAYPPNSVYFTSDGKYIVSCSNNNFLIIWDAETGKELLKVEKIGGNSTLPSLISKTSNDGRYYVSVSYNTVRLWKKKNDDNPHIIENANCKSAIAFSPDGKCIAAASDEKILVWDAETEEVLLRLVGHKRCVNSVAFSPDGRCIASSALYDTIIVWDAVTGSELLRIKENTYKVNSVAFSPDGKKMVSETGEEDADDRFKLSYQYSVFIWDAETGEQIKELYGHSYIAHSAIFTPNGKSVVSASSDKTVRIWNVEADGSFIVLQGHNDKVRAIAISPDGTRIISGSDGGSIRVWNSDTGIELLDISSPRTKTVSFSPDGKWIVSAGNGIRIWDTEIGYELWEIEGEYTSAVMSPDGKRIASVLYDGSVKMWSFPHLQSLINANHTCYKNFPLSSKERQKYYLD